MNEQQFILVIGYGWSGSSAVVDLLKEYANTIEADIEFRIIKDPYGITDLYNALFKKGDPLNYDTAIKDFLWYAHKLNQKPSKFVSGLGYNQFFGDTFDKETKDYVDQIVDFQYESDWWMFSFKKSRFELIKAKVMQKLSLNKSKMYFTNISRDDFIGLTREYIGHLFNNSFKNGVRSVILDQGISVLNCIEEMQYFSNAKVIIVDRDPRDIYTDLCTGNFLIGKELAKTRDAKKYVGWHNSYRKNIKELRGNNNILMMNFEDIVLNYNSSVKRIEDFLGLDSTEHIKKCELFNPEISKNNIGIWKNYLNHKEIDIFNRELKEYLVELR